MDLTKKQEEFAKEYLETGNGTQSVLATNSDVTNDNSAAAIASRMLRNAKVKAFLEDKAELAAIRIQELSEQSENLNVALGASKDILDRAGFKPIDKSEITGKDGKDLIPKGNDKEVIEGALNNL